MASILDLIQSAIVAGLISLMVIGVHFMTMKSSTENQVIQHMQGTGDGAIAILQEEIRFLQSFTSDKVKVENNSLSFRNNYDNIVFIEVHNDSLVVAQYSLNPSNLIRQGTVLHFIADNSLKTPGGYTVPYGYAIDLSDPNTGEDGQIKIIESYNNNGDVTVKGTWDFIPTTMPHYKVYEADRISYRSYQLNLLDQSGQGKYAFNMISLDASGQEETITDPAIPVSDIDLIRTTISIRSKPEQLYSDSHTDFVIPLEKEFFLRGHRLFSSEEM